jgi:hypothetical protein
MTALRQFRAIEKCANSLLGKSVATWKSPSQSIESKNYKI